MMRYAWFTWGNSIFASTAFFLFGRTRDNFLNYRSLHDKLLKISRLGGKRNVYSKKNAYGCDIDDFICWIIY